MSCILLGAGNPAVDNYGHQGNSGGSSWATGSLVHFWLLSGHTWRPRLGQFTPPQGECKMFSLLAPRLESCIGLPQGSMDHAELPLTCSHIPSRTDVCRAHPPGCAKNSCTQCSKFKAALIPTPSAQCQKGSPLLFVMSTIRFCHSLRS